MTQRTTDPRQEQLEQTLDAYVSGDAGVPFEALTRLAEPIFALYDLDPSLPVGRKYASIDTLELSLLVAVLETARLFWSYFMLDPQVQENELGALRTRLLGGEADYEEEADFLELYSLIRERWEALAANGGIPPAPALPPFEVLVQEFAPVDGEDDVQRVGPMGMELPEAMALFARPLLDGVAVEDPDLLDEALARAAIYWEIANTVGDDREALVQCHRARFEALGEATRFDTDLEMMLRRFNELFA